MTGSLSGPIRVLLADDHTLVREGIKQLLGASGDIAVEGEAANGDEALALARGAEFDVAVLDMSMPGLAGIELIKRLRIERREPFGMRVERRGRGDQGRRVIQIPVKGLY
mgnify:CR=1 FL=1